MLTFVLTRRQWKDAYKVIAMTVNVVKQGKVKKVFIETALNLNKKNNSIDYGLCDSIGRAIHDYSDVAEINIIWLRNTQLSWEKYITKAMGNFNVKSGGDLTDAWVDVTVYDYSSDEYTIDHIVLGHANLTAMYSYNRAYCEASVDITKSKLEYLEINWRLWIKG